jgi:UrcA family protein
MTWKFHFILPLLSAVLALASFPAAAQQPASTGAVSTWNPTREMVIVNGIPFKEFRGVMTGTHLTGAIMVSASMPVPYGDLNLTQSLGVDEFARRIHIAAQMVCDQLDVKYPQTTYPTLDGATSDDCVKGATDDGMVLANQVVASKQQR